MKARLLIIAGLTVGFSLWALALQAQGTGVCKGDFDGDNHVTIEEIIAQ